MSIQNVLVVDDMPMIVDKIKGIISELGIHVVTATTGKEAVENARSNPPDLIFMDVMMPEMDGFAACRKLRSEVETKNIPVVFVSSRDQASDKMWARMQGAEAYVTKPFTKQDIIEQVNAFQ